MSEIIFPEFHKDSFTCPHCGVCCEFENQMIPKRYKGPMKLERDPYQEQCIDVIPADFFEFFNGYEWIVKVCHHCGKITLWHERKLVYPTKTGIEPTKHMPESVKGIFIEAQNIARLSPRAAVALLRLCIERALSEAGATGEKLHEQMKSLELSKRMFKLCEACRLAGNEAVHRDGFDFSVTNDEALIIVYSLSKFIIRLCEEIFETEAEAEEIIETMKSVR